MLGSMNLSRRAMLQLPPFGVLASSSAAQKPRLPRKDSFFGLHFDLHPSKGDKELGADLSEEMVEKFLNAVRPDYVQYDCKGHVGYLGYPSKVGVSAPGIVRDSLDIWRRVTLRHGVALYIHFSGVWDNVAVELHPEWSRITEKGERDREKTSTFGPYVDQLMIPELEEVSARYSLDGVWVDGECWATGPDYYSAAIESFRKATGLEAPRSREEKGWLEWLEFNREQFRKYLKHYLDHLHRTRPGFQIASNWMYSTFVPEKPELPVDFISGDYLGNASISSARLEARYLQSTGKPWDLMAWGFQSARGNPVGSVHKPAVQLEQEASVVLAQGGGFQIFYQPTRAGRLVATHVNVMAALAEFCRARQQFCHQSETVPEIGLLFSKHSLYATSNKLFGGWGSHVNAARGVLDALIECHLPVDVIPDWKFEEMAPRYRLLAVPDWTDIGEDAAKQVAAYARGGGRVLIIGAENAARLGELLGVRLKGQARDQQAYVAGGELMANVRGVWQEVELAGAKEIARRHATWDPARPGVIAATLHGNACGIYGPIGKVFAATHAPATRVFLGNIVKQLYEPGLRIGGPPTLEAVLRRKGGRTVLFLNNSTAMQVAGDYAAMDFVPSVGPVNVSLKLETKPARVTLQPQGRPAAGTYRDGWWSGTLERVEIQQLLVFE